MPALINALRQMATARLAGFNDTIAASLTNSPSTPVLDVSDYEGQIWVYQAAQATTGAHTLDQSVQTSDDSAFGSGNVTLGSFAQLLASTVAANSPTGSAAALAIDTNSCKRYIRILTTTNATATPHWWVTVSVIGVKQYTN